MWLQSNDGWKLAQMHISPYRSFESSIQEFEAQDRMQPPRPRGVVFVGSSSIRMWKSLPADFPGVNCIPRGFGGSQLVDSVIYAHRVITPYKPRKVVVYAGDNDISAGKDAQRVLQDFRLLVESVHERVPDAEIGFVAIKPSISRWRLWPEMNRANQLVAEFAASRPCVTYLDVATPMLGPDGGQPAAELFLADGLHMTPQGYAIWTKVIRPWVEAPRTAGCGAAG